MIALGAKMARVDGDVSRAELEAFRSFFQVPPSEERNVERFFNLLKHFRAIATRYDKLARNFLAGVQLAAITILLN